MKFYVIAGEASGDLHGANLIKAFNELEPEHEFRAWGGDLMEAEGAHVVKHYRDLAFMGFIEVIANLKTILRNMKACKEDILTHKPDAVILIDYPGFNLRIATFCKQHNIPVLYYISPQIWAWKEGRIKRIKRDITKLFAILPFEKAFYAKHGMDVEYVGHPLLDAIDQDAKVKAEAEFRSQNKLENKRILAVLPGSRKQEILTSLPIMLEVIKKHPEFHYVIAGAPGQIKEFYLDIPGVKESNLVFNQTYGLFSSAEAGLVTSGTATLEAAIHGMPQVVCYTASTISYHIAKRLVKIKFISLVNLIMDREVVTELIQHDFNANRLEHELTLLLDDSDRRSIMMKDYEALTKKLGGAGAAKRTAQSMLEVIKKEQTSS
jgi:lipid-A-disaccharide synthase